MTGHSTTSIQQFELFIDSKSFPAESGETIPIVDSATEETFATIAAGGASDIDRAATVASESTTAWLEMSPPERGRVLNRAAMLIRKNKESLAELLTRENGKPISQARTEIEVGARYFEYYAGATDKIQGETIPLGREYVDFTIREPLGVTGHIVPWNFPVSLFARSVAPSLAAGNAVVVKPAEQTPLTSVELGKLLDEAGIPDGTINVVPGYGAEAGAALTNHSDITAIAFTGSVPTGKKVAATAARQMKHVHIEAGGKNPNVVFPDADLEAAIEGTLISIFTRNAGQVCSAGDRLLVHKEVHEEFLKELVERVEALTVGPGLEDPDIGALVSEEQYKKVRKYIKIGRRELGEPLVNGVPKNTDKMAGYFVGPTIFDDANNDLRIAREEIFGPVLTVIPFETETEALEIANDSDYGLSAGIFTNDLERAHRFARDVIAGQVYINEWFAGGVETPFGGHRESGFGREKGLEALDQFTTTKNVCLSIGE
ncbi:aldehyde dehydrogenase family protein [Halalkalicoccus jeotgali]|uniref:Aldehyde dehydrogenase (Acceptor) n=1 Tax=Halalkalicoccus jeotgali (strain DSM 18796 / CECT 7217 / JCM 14584 / KCTC 4019 / B3) TaxID=795797 RepID=D8JCW0_HALJB|nr:aldehyde dehydrogenase family protein [Halalkalicoccus jeotgali]ADJ16855.1 aldehyde dehydrogenase (acceptor) [Halalkalicoccus jeotgali B3]ELY38709.1 aldehyde dehydrogenase (acceptor) [Halalkalicoccus jeotgali B3]